jgi:hypothetical protein
MNTNNIYYLDKPGGNFTLKKEEIQSPKKGEILIKIRRTSVCQSDVVIYYHGLPRIKQWPTVVLHEVSGEVASVGEGVTKFSAGDIVGIGCDIPCGDRDCLYCGEKGTGDWTSCPNTWATGHEFPGFSRQYALLPDWFVDLGPIKKFPKEIDLDLDTETPEGDEDTNISIDDTSAPSSDNPLVSTLQDILLKALDTAEQLGDDKLTKQIGNTVTMFTRTHISQPDQPINEKYDEDDKK